MSKTEIKEEINKVLDILPDKTLEELLSYLKSVEKNTSSSIFDPERIQKILTEDKRLLQKLAQ